MTDKLRGLAERWRKEASNTFGFHAARKCADELLAILDAEGDGGAVAWVADLAPGVERSKEYMGIFTPYKNYADYLAKNPDYVVTPLYTHPARSGVVSDEDVEECWMVLTGRAGSIAHEKDHECMMDIERKAVRAALEHFARRTP